MAPPSKSNSSTKRLLLYCVAFVAVTVLTVTLLSRRYSPGTKTPQSANSRISPVVDSSDKAIFSAYGRSESCKSCHESEYRQWRSSHHGLAERPVDPALDSAAFSGQPKIIHASQTSDVAISNGTFQIITAGLDGERRAFAPERVIGVDPLRQFMIPGSGGRFQVTELAFDPNHTNWFDVYGEEDRRPGEWGHWTGRGMTWNSMCASCHNTRLRKHYVETDDTYATTMAEMSVACEACHGPMAAHNKWQNDNHQKSAARAADPTVKHFSRDQILHTCASCHSRRAELTGEFVPGDNFFDHYALSIPDETDLFYPDGQIRDEDYEFTAFLGSRMHAAGVRCMDCHEPHSGKTRLEGNALCMACHATGKPLLPIATQAGAVIGLAPIIDPLPHSHHKSGQPGDRCIDCHMPITHYMQRHGRHDHGFTVPDPLLTKEAAIPNACNRCHADRNIDWAIAAIEKWYGGRMDRPARARTRILAHAKAGTAKSSQELLRLCRTETNGLWRAVSAGFLRRWTGDTNAITALIAATDDHEPLVRAMSVRSLEAVSEFAPANRVLQSRLTDPVRSARVDAAWNLRQSVDTNYPAGADLLAYLRYSGDQPSGAMQTGIFEMDRGDIAEAIRYLRQAVAWDTNSAPPRHALAVALSLEGKADEAVEQLQAACRLAPRDAEMQFKLGLALNEAGRPDDARLALEKTVKLDPQFAQAWYNLGLAYNAAGQTGAAIDALVRAESIDHEAAQIPYVRATILARLGRIEEAREAIRRALERQPNYPEAINLLQSLDR